MMGVVLAFTGVTAVLMGWIGIPLMSWIYGLDFEPYRGLAYVMVAAGGVTAAVDFLYQVITVLRRQGDVETALFHHVRLFGFRAHLAHQFHGLARCRNRLPHRYGDSARCSPWNYDSCAIQPWRGVARRRRGFGSYADVACEPCYVRGALISPRLMRCEFARKRKKAMHSAREQVKTGKTNVVRSHGSHAESADGPARAPRVHGHNGQTSQRVRVSGATVASSRVSSDAETREREQREFVPSLWNRLRKEAALLK